MSYSALTSLGVKPICPGCKKEIKDRDPVILVLLSTAYVVSDYNTENEMNPEEVTTEMDWSDQSAYHVGCLSIEWEKPKEDPTSLRARGWVV